MEANDKLRVARESRGLTQTNAAAICNVALRTFQDWEKGKNSNALGAMDKLRNYGSSQS
jgi:DNA-binding XRE family transcriptional regulator